MASASTTRTPTADAPCASKIERQSRPATSRRAMGGTAVVEAGGATLPWGEIKSDAVGKAIAHDGTGEILGYAVTGATADGQKIEVLLKF